MKCRSKNVLCHCKKCNKPFKWSHEIDLCKECAEREAGLRKETFTRGISLNQAKLLLGLSESEASEEVK